MTLGSSFAPRISPAARPAPRAAKALADDPDDVGLQRIRLPHLVEESQSQLPLLAFLARATLARAVASCHELDELPIVSIQTCLNQNVYGGRPRGAGAGGVGRSHRISDASGGDGGTGEDRAPDRAAYPTHRARSAGEDEHEDPIFAQRAQRCATRGYLRALAPPLKKGSPPAQTARRKARFEYLRAPGGGRGRSMCSELLEKN